MNSKPELNYESQELGQPGCMLSRGFREHLPRATRCADGRTEVLKEAASSQGSEIKGER